MTIENSLSTNPYNKNYYDYHFGSIPYEREQPVWRNFFNTLAKTIIERFHPVRVMDVGCAKGFLVEHLRDGGVEAYGIDISSYAISEVRPDIKPYCHVATAMQPLEEYYDLITCIEVAEHLTEEEGRQLIKNICQHTDEVLFSSTATDFDEPTHINVQPPQYWKAFFAEHDFYPDLHFEPNFGIPHAIHFRSARKSSLDIAVFSNITPNEPVAMVRLVAPIQTLEQRDRLRLHFFNVNKKLDFEKILNSDLFIIHREVADYRRSSVIIETARRLGKPTVFELDDLLINVPRFNPGWAYYKLLTPDILATIQEVDFVTVSTEQLKKELQYAIPGCEDKIYVLPNYIDLTLWGSEVSQQTTQNKVQEPLVIGWVGTPTHDDDLAIVKPAIAHILSKYKGKVVFKLWGYIPKELEDLEDVVLVRGMQPDVRQHAYEMCQSHIDLALAPLADQPFNHSKSNIKWLEYSICRIAGIYSNITPYSSTVVHGYTGWLVDNKTEAWVEAIEQLINNVSLREEIAHNAYQEVLHKHCLEVGATQWDLLYRSFVVSGKKPEAGLHSSSSNERFLRARTQLPDQWLKLLHHTLAVSKSKSTPEASLSSDKEDIRKARKQLADHWLNLPATQIELTYLGELGTVHQFLVNNGIKVEPLTDSEQNFVNELVANVSKGLTDPKAINYLLAAMLYCHAYQLPLQHDITYIPQWLLNGYLKYVLSYPRLFQEVGEADNYCRYVQQLIEYLYDSIFSNTNSDLWQNIATDFSRVANFIRLYFNEANLKEVYIKRAEILEWVLKLNAYEVDYEFGARAVNRKKIRLGILAEHFTPGAETFASLPVYEHISRNFEVILYSLHQTGHPLEEYCQSCANSFKLLSKNLAEQVDLIRGDNLDILFIATNVTAEANQICLLSLHRLARIQATSVASVVTTGMRHVDYYISGQLSDPHTTAEHHYIEKLLKLEGTAQCFSYGSETEKSTIKIDRESLGISQETVVFISGANFFKIIPELIDIWARIIATVPNSILWLLPFGPNWSNTYPKKPFLDQLSKIFSKHGVAAECLMVLDPQPVPNREDVKEYYKIANVYLDSYPFSGTSSLVEPLEVGLPVLARQGACFRSTMGAAILRLLDVPGLVADSEEAYIKLAIALGTNSELRQQKSNQIKQRMQANPSFLDSRSYSAQMGVLFQDLFRKYQESTLTENLKLRETNLIIFPDWSQPEQNLYQEIANVLTNLLNHPNHQVTLLVSSGNLSEDEVSFFVSDVAMNLLLEAELDVTNSIEIAPTGQLSEMQWQILLPRIHARIILENEDRDAIASVKADALEVYQLRSFSEISPI